MLLEVTGQRLLQHRGLGAHGAAGHLRQHLGTTLTGDHRGEHLPAGHPEDVADHAGELDLGVLEQLLDPLLLPGPFPDQRAAVTGQVPQLPKRFGVHQAR
jgi:hypothetical protein